MNEIKLGSGRKNKYDYQFVKQVESHLQAIIKPEGWESMVTFSKVGADPWPHQCRYFKPCPEIVNNFTHNYGHFKRVHPWTDAEREFLLQLFEESPNSKNVYTLSFLYGRSETELKNFFLTHVKHIPKWGRKVKEVDAVHEMIGSQLQDLRLNNRVRLEAKEQEKNMTSFWNADAELPKYELIPNRIVEIQSQNYLIPPPATPDKLGSKEFYKSLVDAFFDKHKAWIERESHLKNRVQELENTISELKNKLLEKIEEPDISEEQEAEYTEQMNTIRQDF